MAGRLAGRIGVYRPISISRSQSGPPSEPISRPSICRMEQPPSKRPRPLARPRKIRPSTWRIAHRFCSCYPAWCRVDLLQEGASNGSANDRPVVTNAQHDAVIVDTDMGLDDIATIALLAAKGCNLQLVTTVNATLYLLRARTQLLCHSVVTTDPTLS